MNRDSETVRRTGDSPASPSHARTGACFVYGDKLRLSPKLKALESPVSDSSPYSLPFQTLQGSIIVIQNLSGVYQRTKQYYYGRNVTASPEISP